MTTGRKKKESKREREGKGDFKIVEIKKNTYIIYYIFFTINFKYYKRSIKNDK